MKRSIILTTVLTIAFHLAHAQYIEAILDYQPAPGQFINKAPWGVPFEPGQGIEGLNGQASLGAFGGYIVFKFDSPVANDPRHPYGVDFTIVGNPLADWSEPGIVWVMKDENGNGEPDDTWYELAGSDYFLPSTVKGYEVTYQNPQMDDVATDVNWTDNQGGQGTIKANAFHNQQYYPLPSIFGSAETEQLTLKGTRIASNVAQLPTGFVVSPKRTFGYADNNPLNSAWISKNLNSLELSVLHQIPDNPYTEELENSGGDAFDISWAVDEAGNYVTLDEIHFVKVQNATLADAFALGEVSTEIVGAVKVAPNDTLSGPTSVAIIHSLPDSMKTGIEYTIPLLAFENGRLSDNPNITWETDNPGVQISQDGVLIADEPNTVLVSVFFSDNPDIRTSVTVNIEKGELVTGLEPGLATGITLYPNPTNHSAYLSGNGPMEVSIYNIAGALVNQLERYMPNTPLAVGQLPQGVYVVHVKQGESIKAIRMVKQ